MRIRLAFLLGGLAVAAMTLAFAEGPNMSLPKTVEAGNAFSVQSTGSGKATLYIIGPGQALKRDVQLGKTTFFSAGSLYNAGHYLAVLTEDSSAQSGTFDVVPSSKPEDLGFLAKPSRLPVGLHDGITGAVYVFDAYHNLITTPMPVSFELSNPSGTVQKRTVTDREGAAWTEMDSTAQQGIDKFVVRIGDISSTRVVGQVPGDPCGLKMSARQSGQKLQLMTDPVRDCNGNAVPDGTIVTFTENYNGGQSTVDVPLKHGIAEVQIAAINGATISVASGVVLGNQIRWEK
ncbi:MAG: hypothetical protein ABSE51_07165 [Terracidiphilus sp.]|jgi:hypothetical protein